MTTYFITGIDTGIGKTYATAMLAKSLLDRGKSVITAKLAQTGCVGIAEDIIQHRKIMGIDLLSEDNQKLTCPYTFKLPASPHLAARQENTAIDANVIINAISQLEKIYDIVLVEGAGGLLVPLDDDLLTADFVAAQRWPVIIVSSPRLGSINHTLMTLECAHNRNCDVVGIIYNMHQQSAPVITADSQKIISDKLKQYNPTAKLIELPKIDDFENLPETNLHTLIP
ncbi:MAG: ATP-dependent dethiobiotin synthetase BioD [Phycisphaerae bacterium]|nr:ATP-dependent dethiobiotin synthetase BioD [Phycisphaerae bacterium]